MLITITKAKLNDNRISFEYIERKTPESTIESGEVKSGAESVLVTQNDLQHYSSIMKAIITMFRDRDDDIFDFDEALDDIIKIKTSAGTKDA